jgi:hypothetical protein
MVVRVGHAPQQPCAPHGLVMARNGSSDVGRELRLCAGTPQHTYSLRPVDVNGRMLVWPHSDPRPWGVRGEGN